MAVKPGQSLPDALWSAPSARKRWLLVIDNLDQPQALSPIGEPLAEHRGWVRAELVDVDALSTEDAATVLMDTAPQAGDRTQAKALAARLGGFPLALRVAGRMVAQPMARYRTFEVYREALDAELGDILATPHTGALTADQKRALLRYTWDLSLDQLADAGLPQARPPLRVLSLAADAPLPRDLITPDLAQGQGHAGRRGRHSRRPAVRVGASMSATPKLLEGRWLSPGETGAVVLNQITRDNTVPGMPAAALCNWSSAAIPPLGGSSVWWKNEKAAAAVCTPHLKVSLRPQDSPSRRTRCVSQPTAMTSRAARRWPMLCPRRLQMPESR